METILTLKKYSNCISVLVLLRYIGTKYLFICLMFIFLSIFVYIHNQCLYTKSTFKLQVIQKINQRKRKKCACIFSFLRKLNCNVNKKYLLFYVAIKNLKIREQIHFTKGGGNPDALPPPTPFTPFCFFIIVFFSHI